MSTMKQRDRGRKTRSCRQPERSSSNQRRRTRPRVWKSLAVSAAALTAMTFTATSAHAAEVRYKGAYAEVHPDVVKSICDMETDGNGAFVEVHLANGTQKKYWDGSGHDSHCGGPFYPNSAILSFKVCEDHTGCSKLTRPSWREL